MGSPGRAIWVERAIWALIFGGLVTLALGLAMHKAEDAAAWILIAVGAGAAVAGGVLIWVRSRMDGDSG